MKTHCAAFIPSLLPKTFSPFLKDFHIFIIKIPDSYRTFQTQRVWPTPDFSMNARWSPSQSQSRERRRASHSITRSMVFSPMVASKTSLNGEVKTICSFKCYVLRLVLFRIRLLMSFEMQISKPVTTFLKKAASLNMALSKNYTETLSSSSAESNKRSESGDHAEMWTLFRL